jgi:hypothetical protein
MTCSDEDRGKSRRPGAEDRRWSHRSGTRWSGCREVGWRRVRSAPGTWRLEARVSWLSLKTKVVKGFPVWASKPALWFGDLGLKITATVSWFGPQNQVGFGLSVAPQNRRREVGVGHASRSSSLFGVEASLARVSQSGLKTGGGATMGAARGTIAEIASEAS